MNKSPLVSIIIPVYKVEKYLEQCLESVVSQSLEDIEIIIVDEGDLDECRKIIDKFELSDKRIKTVHEKNGCYGAAVNKGIVLARGEYIGIVEGDDFIDSSMVFDLYKKAKEYDADIVKSDFYYYETSKNISRKAGKIPKDKTDRILNIQNEPDILKIQPSIWSAIYKREFLINSNIRFLENKGGSYQDTSFAFKALSLAQKIVLTKKAYLHYRIDNENSSVNISNNPCAICAEYDEIEDFLNKNRKIGALVNDIKLINQFNAYMWNLLRIDEKYRADFIAKFAFEFMRYRKNNELTLKFYKKVNKKEVELLLNDTGAFKIYISKLAKKKMKRNERQKSFSLRLNPSRISLVLFGKQILEKEF